MKTYVNLALSCAYCPHPNKGGIEMRIDMLQINQMYLAVKKVVGVGKCQDLSSRTTERYRTTAIPVIVYNEFMPAKEVQLSCLTVGRLQI